jgi:GH15 family glucan-1,4-alpha-glucosidase
MNETLAGIGLVGNCQAAAHIDRDGNVVWCCLPRFDSEPIFGALLDAENGGRFTITAASGVRGRQRYLPNTNILETSFEDDDGAFRVIDFFPRFMQHERAFRPTMLIRIVEPVRGTPRVMVRCQPRLGWSRGIPREEHGSHHVEYMGFPDRLRLTTDAPLAALSGRPFALMERKHYVLAWGQPVEESLVPLCTRFLDATAAYWQRWVKHCVIPADYQAEVIRSALALKLHCYEDTGAIVAALTTSIPEAPGSGRTWDYRYCWLRDAYYALAAFGLLGHFEEREQFLRYLFDVCAASPNLDLQPLYRIDGARDLSERILPDWPGYAGEGPVRVGNQAAEHTQLDIYGEAVLALTPLFMDARFADQQTPAALDLIVRLARKAAGFAGQPDAGIWEYRTGWRPQTFSSLMCWAALDRAASITRRHAPELEADLALHATRIRADLLAQGIDPGRQALVGSYGGNEVDAAMLQAITLRLLSPDDPRAHATIEIIRNDLAHSGWLHRYRTDDGFGVPTVAFMICTLWLAEALALVGRQAEARVILDQLGTVQSPLGLLAEDVDPVTGTMWGNFPQAYSHVGLIHAAFAASRPWSGVL